MVKKYGDLYLEARRALLPTEGEQASGIARELLCKLSGKSAAQLIADGGLYASEQIETELKRGVDRILDGEPLAYVLGEWDFYGLTLRVTRDTLIPRDDTAAVTELAIEALDGIPARVLDLCTGTGCIGLAIASALPDVHVTLADVSAAALRVARGNAAQLHLSQRASCVPLDVRKPVPAFLGQYDLIVSNPPYITDAEMETLPDSVRRFEPALALCGGADGLVFYRAIAENFAPALKEGGFLCLEFGMGQEKAVCKILAENGFADCRLREDARGITRAVIARKKESELLKSEEEGR